MRSNTVERYCRGYVEPKGRMDPDHPRPLRPVRVGLEAQEGDVYVRVRIGTRSGTFRSAVYLPIDEMRELLREYDAEFAPAADPVVEQHPLNNAIERDA